MYTYAQAQTNQQQKPITSTIRSPSQSPAYLPNSSSPGTTSPYGMSYSPSYNVTMGQSRPGAGSSMVPAAQTLTSAKPYDPAAAGTDGPMNSDSSDQDSEK